MKVRVGAIGVLLVVAAAVAALSANGNDRSVGRLSGVTQISYGCPGPQRDGVPCERWSTFPGARFRVAPLGGGAPRTLTSDARGRFTLLLAVGRYRITPLRQAHTTGGTSVVVAVRVAATTWTRVRFQGYPRML